MIDNALTCFLNFRAFVISDFLFTARPVVDKTEAAGPLDTEAAWCYGLSRRVEATAGMWKGEVWIQIVN